MFFTFTHFHISLLTKMPSSENDGEKNAITFTLYLTSDSDSVFSTCNIPGHCWTDW